MSEPTLREDLVRRALLAMAEVDQSSRGEAEARVCVEAVLDALAISDQVVLLAQWDAMLGEDEPECAIYKGMRSKTRAVLARIRGEVS